MKKADLTIAITGSKQQILDTLAIGSEYLDVNLFDSPSHLEELVKLKYGKKTNVQSIQYNTGCQSKPEKLITLVIK